MLEEYFESFFTLEQLRKSPAGPWLDGFAGWLFETRYSWWTGRQYLRAANHLGHFLHGRKVAVGAADHTAIAVFRRHLRRCRCPKPRGPRNEETVRGAKCFFQYLQRAGVIASEPMGQPWPPLVMGFCRWLQHHRGVSETTLSHYGTAAVELLEALGNDPNRYDAKSVRAFLLKRSRRRGVPGTKAISSALRMFLRYLATQGKCRAGLDGAIPSIAGHRLASLPRCLSSEEVDRLLAACDSASAMGIRDRAVIILLARLGLRASDVASLRLADFDWHDGSVVVSGKSRRQVRLPLAQEVGDAILAYLQYRPCVEQPRIFLRSIAPFRALPRSSVSQIVSRAMKRAGVVAPTYGSHILRHTAATEMLRQGVSLYDIGSVLRHRSADMSAYYAKVDMGLLKQVVQPWPKVLSC